MNDAEHCYICEGLVEAKKKLARDSFWLSLTAPEIARAAAPGRFVKVRAWPEPWQAGSPFLDRPLSIHRASRSRLELLFRVVGPATALLSQLEAGASIKLTGPLGHGFELDPQWRQVYLVGGGIGLAPLALLCDRLREAGLKWRLFYGERRAQAQVDEPWLKSWAGELHACCEDGLGYGEKGLVTEALARALATEPGPVLACGPSPMLAAAATLAQKLGVPCQVSLEAGMACGLGVCLTCSLPLVEGGRLRVCREGPVVDGLTVDWKGLRS